MTLTGKHLLFTATVLLLVALIVGFNLSFRLLYDQSRDVVDRSLGDRLTSIARAVVPEITSDIESDLELGGLSLSTVIRLKSYFDLIRRTDELYGIYLLDDQNNDLLALDDSATVLPLLSSLHSENIDRAWLAEENVSQLYQTGNRYFKAAFHPVGTDSVIAVLVVESSFGFFDDLSTYSDNVFLVNVIALLFLAAVGAAILLLNRRLLRAEKLLMSQAALSQMGQMAAVIAHEVRNPLAIIKATAERLRKEYRQADKEDELFDFIPEEVDRLNQITTSYLQFASPAVSGGEIEPVAGVIESVAGGILKQFERKGTTLDWKVEPVASDLRIDSSALRQIMVNLLRNSLDACPDGGDVSVLVAAGDRPGEVKITVADSGNGMSRKELKKIFDPFYTTKSQGSGLGLYVVRRLVENLGGTINVSSEQNVGTKFVVELTGRK